MQEILLRVRVSQYASCRQLVDALELGADDLLLTNRYIYDSYFAGFELPCQVVFQEKYGAGEPSDDMAEAIYADIKGEPKRIVAVGGGTIIDLAKFLR